MGAIGLLISLFVFVLPFAGFGQVKHIGIPNIKNYSKADYRAGTQNWGIARDSKGFMYFANNYGVLQFDGIHWNLTEVSQSAAVRSILIDETNTIYIGLYNDFGILQTNESGRYFFKSLRNLLPPEITNFDEIWKIHKVPGGIAFQAFDYLFLLENNEINVIEPQNRFHFSFSVKDRLYINEPEMGLFEYKDGAITHVPGTEKITGKEIWGIIALNDSSLLIGTNTSGLFAYTNGELVKWDTPVNELVQKYQLYSLAPVGGNYLAFGTILNGIVISDINGRIVQHINISNGLKNNTVLSIFPDNNQNLWLGLDNGIDYLEINSPISYNTDFGKIGTGYASRIFDDKLYLGTNQGLYVKSFSPDSPAEENFQLVENTVGQVWSLDVFNNQLLCGHNSGTLLIEGNNAIKIGNEEGVWRFIPLQQDPNVLLAGHYNGLLILRKTGNEWTFSDRLEGFNESSRFIEQDADGMIWVSHGSKGIYRIELNEELDSVVDYKLYTAEDGLPSNEQNILFRFKEKLYISTVNGFFQYHSEHDAFVRSEDLNIFSLSGQIKTLQPDDYGNYWFITDIESGVFRLNEDLTYTKVTLPFRQLDGKYVNGFEYIYPYDNENILFGIDNGFAHYSSKFSKQYIQPLYAFITKVEAPYIDSTLFLLNKDNGTEYRFPFNRNSFRFHYTAPFYEHQDRVEFSFMLENYQDNWSSWSETSYKDFTNLPQGHYNFSLKARNIFGVESEVSSFGFHILPPWYNTGIARGVYAFLFLGFLVLILRYTHYRIEQTRKRVITQHSDELKLKEDKFQLQQLITEKEIIKLKNEKLEGEMVYRNKELANQTMGIIQKNEFLVNIKEELYRITKTSSEEKVRKRLAAITRTINKEIDNKQQNHLFETYFDEVHHDFFKRLKDKYPGLTPREMRLCAYIRMNLTSKEIAALLNISDRGVEISRYRLRKKMELSRDTNLSTYLANI